MESTFHVHMHEEQGQRFLCCQEGNILAKFLQLDDLIHINVGRRLGVIWLKHASISKSQKDRVIQPGNLHQRPCKSSPEFLE